LAPVHHHVQGQLPDIAVGVPDAHEGVGVVSELKVALHVPLIICRHAFPTIVYPPLQLVGVHVPQELPHHVCDPFPLVITHARVFDTKVIPLSSVWYPDAAVYLQFVVLAVVLYAHTRVGV
jgi:hypothetical protein